MAEQSGDPNQANEWESAEELAELGQTPEQKEAEELLRADHPTSQVSLEASSPRVQTNPIELDHGDAYSDLGGGLPPRHRPDTQPQASVELSKLPKDQHTAAMDELRDIRHRIMHSDTRDEAAQQLSDWERRYRRG